MTDRLRETDALPFSEPELKGWQMGADSGATATNHNVRRFLATIERQGKAIEDLELRLHQTNDAHALSCSERLKALTEIERQGKALRAVEALCFQREQMMAGEPNPAFAAQLTTAEVRAALAQAETPTADGEGQ